MNRAVKIISVIFAFVTLFSLFSCGVKEDDVVLDINTKGAELLSLASFDDNLAEVNNLFMSAAIGDVGAVTDAKVYMAESGATAEALFLIYCDELQNVDSVKTLLTAYVEDQISGFEDYNPTEVPKLKDAVIISRGHYILYCVAKDASALPSAFEALFK